MNTRGIIGKRIKSIRQQMIKPGGNRSMSNSVFWIELEDGTRLIPVVCEGEDNYHVDFAVNKRWKK